MRPTPQGNAEIRAGDIDAGPLPVKHRKVICETPAQREAARLARRARVYEAWANGETMAGIGRRERRTGMAIKGLLDRHRAWLERAEKRAATLVKCASFRAEKAEPIIIADEPEALGEWQDWTPEAQHLEIAASRRDVLILA